MSFSSFRGRFEDSHLIAKKGSTLSSGKKLRCHLLSKTNHYFTRPRRSRAHQQPTQTKMIAETKDFKTITLRGLEEKKNLVEIMNQVMQTKGLKTGQSVIEFIISDYAQKLAELEAIKLKREGERQRYYKWSSQKEDKIEELSTTIKTIKDAFALLNKTEI